MLAPLRGSEQARRHSREHTADRHGDAARRVRIGREPCWAAHPIHRVCQRRARWRDPVLRLDGHTYIDRPGLSEAIGMCGSRCPLRILALRQVARLQSVGQHFGLRVRCHRNREIGVSGESRFGADRNGQAVNQCERNVDVRDIGGISRSAASSDITPACRDRRHTAGDVQPC
jgi:hypothetical protein